MRESAYQKKIIKDIESDGGWVVNGSYTKAGEADLQAGIPTTVCDRKLLLHCAIEVKTQYDYDRVMSGIDEDYTVVDSKKLKKHEVLQMTKIRLLRKKGGLALVAYNYGQVLEYIERKING